MDAISIQCLATNASKEQEFCGLLRIQLITKQTHLVFDRHCDLQISMTFHIGGLFNLFSAAVLTFIEELATGMWSLENLPICLLMSLYNCSFLS